MVKINPKHGHVMCTITNFVHDKRTCGQLRYRYKHTSTGGTYYYTVFVVPANRQDHLTLLNLFDSKNNMNRASIMVSMLDKKMRDNFLIVLFMHSVPQRTKQGVHDMNWLETIKPCLGVPGNILRYLSCHNIRSYNSQLNPHMSHSWTVLSAFVGKIVECTYPCADKNGYSPMIVEARGLCPPRS